MKKIALMFILVSALAGAEEARTPQGTGTEGKKDERSKAEILGEKLHKELFPDWKAAHLFFAMFKVEGWKSEADVIKTKGALEKVAGVLKVTCSKFEIGRCDVQVDPKVAQESLIYQTVKDLGFTPIPLPKPKRKKPKAARPPLEHQPAPAPGHTPPAPAPSGEKP